VKSRTDPDPAGATAPGWAGPSIIAVLVDTVGVLPVLMTGALAVQLERELGMDAAMLGIVYAAYFAAAAAGSTPSASCRSASDRRSRCASAPSSTCSPCSASSSWSGPRSR
jgi:hypothetical protein